MLHSAKCDAFLVLDDHIHQVPLIFNQKQVFCDRIPSTTPGAEPPRDARDSGSARSHSTHLAPQIDLKWSPTRRLRRYQAMCPLRARDGRYVCQVSRAQRTHSCP